MSNIVQELEAQIRNISTAAAQENVGTIKAVGDGVARIEGLSNAMLNEMIEFPGGVMGLAMNLEENEVGTVIIGNASSLREGDTCKTTGRLLQVPVGPGLLGRVVDTLGNPLDGKGPVEAADHYPVEKIASGIITRQGVNQPIQTGILPIDAMIPIGRGQRELIIGDRSTGKTALALDTIISQANQNRAAEERGDSDYRPVYSIYVAIGQKRANISRLVAKLESCGALAYTIIVVASASDSAAMQYLAPYAGCAMGEYFMDQGKDALIVYDDLSKHAVAYRQVSLILRRPSGREAYPGDVFYLHSRLLERAARINSEGGRKGGSLTALPIIETQAGDVSAYIPTNVISITDGQIFLETELFNAGVRPAVNPGISVSRVGGSAQIKAMKKVAGSLKLLYSQYRELQAFSQFGSDLDADTKARLANGERIVEVLKQPQNTPISVEHQVMIIYAVVNGLLDDVKVSDIQTLQNGLFSYIDTRFPEITKSIQTTGNLDDETAQKLYDAIVEFKKPFDLIK